MEIQYWKTFQTVNVQCLHVGINVSFVCVFFSCEKSVLMKYRNTHFGILCVIVVAIIKLYILDIKLIKLNTYLNNNGGLNCIQLTP